MIPPLVGKYIVTSDFGWRDNPLNPGQTKFHAGSDLDQPDGSKVVAPEAGIVVASGWNDCTGNTITIYHPVLGAFTQYHHLQSRLVSVKDSVRLGQQIGAIGNTGSCTTGGHLHFNVIIPDDSSLAKGTYVDPIAFMMGVVVRDPRGHGLASFAPFTTGPKVTDRKTVSAGPSTGAGSGIALAGLLIMAVAINRSTRAHPQ